MDLHFDEAEAGVLSTEGATGSTAWFETLLDFFQFDICQ